MTAYTDEEIEAEKAALDALEEEEEEEEPEVVTVIVEQYVQRDEKQEKPRKKQHGLTVFIAGAIFAILIYMFTICVENI